MKKLLLFALTLILAVPALATHNRAGEITYSRISAYTYKFQIVVYTKVSANIERCELPIDYGDGTIDTIPRVNGPVVSPGNCPDGVSVGPDIKMSVYEGTHTYSGAGQYRVSMTDPNRNGGVINMTNSTMVPFFIYCDIIINPFLGEANNSPVLLYPPIDNACICKKFIHNAQAFDIDGDSLAYELTNCKEDNNTDAPGFYIPSGITIDPITGDFLWPCPGPSIGEYNFAFLIKEYRRGVLIGVIERDMQVTVEGGCQNDPPIIANINDTCVTAGSLLEFQVNATDANVNTITLSSSGGPFQLSDSPATFDNGVQGTGSVTGNFSWQTACSHVRVQPYSVSFKAADNHPANPLADIQTVQITVVGPAPQGLTATAAGNNITLNWQASSCTEAIGYKIYRRQGFYGFIPDNCETGIPSYTGYTFLADVSGLNTTTFVDNNNGSELLHGVDYCYMIYAYYPDGAKSYASEEVCVRLKRDVPIITNVSILETSPSAGKVYLAWSKPIELDTTATPFKYRIHRSYDGTSFTLIDSLTGGLNDTIYTDQTANLNTESGAVTYRVEVLSNNSSIGYSDKAASPFITATPSDNKLTLTVSATVPWNNFFYYIYKKDDAGIFMLHDSTASTTYVDSGLVNNKEYCYYFITKGGYTIPGLLSPLLNNSQELCASPADQTPPCSPTLAIQPDCDNILNTLTWNNPNLTCADDVVKYNIYFRPVEDTSVALVLLAQISSSTETSYVYNGTNSIAGCYVITALDTFNNESIKSNIVCVDNCPIYTLPNVFTPNGDGNNDLFHPILPYRYVESIDLKIFNRWGQLVFTTTDPDINWDGVNTKTKKMSTDGVYFYTCQINEIRLSGIVPRTITGFVHLYSGKKAGN